MNYFSIKELSQSDTAERLGIDNTIPANLEPNVKRLIAELDKIRGAYKRPITINCGYRCEKLNRAVGGSPTSDHLLARAADLKNTPELQELILKMASLGKIEFDQIIIEKPDKNGVGAWIHISCRPANRRQILIFDGKNYIKK